MERIDGTRARRAGDRGLLLLTWLVAGALLLSLLPVFATSFYDHPAYDDFNYGLPVHQAVQSGGGLLDVIAAAAKRAEIA